MMKDSEQTIGNLVDKSSTAFISYVDKEGFPVATRYFKAKGIQKLPASKALQAEIEQLAREPLEIHLGRSLKYCCKICC